MPLEFLLGSKIYLASPSREVWSGAYQLSFSCTFWSVVILPMAQTLRARPQLRLEVTRKIGKQIKRGKNRRNGASFPIGRKKAKKYTTADRDERATERGFGVKSPLLASAAAAKHNRLVARTDCRRKGGEAIVLRFSQANPLSLLG